MKMFAGFLRSGSTWQEFAAWFSGHRQMHFPGPAALLTVALLLAAPALEAQIKEAFPRSDLEPGAAGRVRPGDQITVRIFREPDLSGQFNVADNGDVVLPRLGRVHVADLSVRELRDSLLTAYSTYLRNPAVEVTVLRRIGIQGEVRRPDVYLVDLTVTLRDAIAHAGGLTEAGNPRSILIIRDDERIAVDGEARFDTLDLRSGDQIVVGRRSWIALNPAVAVSTATGLISFVIGVVLLVR